MGEHRRKTRLKEAIAGRRLGRSTSITTIIPVDSITTTTTTNTERLPHRAPEPSRVYQMEKKNATAVSMGINHVESQRSYRSMSHLSNSSYFSHSFSPSSNFNASSLFLLIPSSSSQTLSSSSKSSSLFIYAVLLALMTTIFTCTLCNANGKTKRSSSQTPSHI